MDCNEYPCHSPEIECAGKNRSGSQKCFCIDCKKYYILDSKTCEIPAETKKQAVKMYLAGVSDRKVGQIFGFSKANILNWIKKPDIELWESGKLDTVLDIFVDAYNAFGEYKLKYRKPIKYRPGNESKHLHHWKGMGCSIFDFVEI